MNSPTRMEGRTDGRGNISFSSWKQTQISSQQTFTICLSPSLLEFRIIFGECSAQLASCPPLRHSPVSYTSHAGSSHSRQWGDAPQSHLLMISPDMFPKKPETLIPLSSNFTASGCRLFPWYTPAKEQVSRWSVSSQSEIQIFNLF